jgi:hypothetical protein
LALGILAASGSHPLKVIISYKKMVDIPNLKSLDLTVLKIKDAYLFICIIKLFKRTLQTSKVFLKAKIEAGIFTGKPWRLGFEWGGQPIPSKRAFCLLN